MKKVFKYPVMSDDSITVALPEGARPLHFDLQHGQLCLWALVDPSKPLVEYKFRMAGTGHPIDTCGDFINTAILQGGALVFHFFHA